MKNSFTLLIILAVFSCSSDDNTVNIDCFTTPISTFEAGECNNNLPDLFCDVTYFGTHHLSATSLMLIGFTCENQNNDLIYTNENLESKRFQIRTLRNQMQRLGYSSNMSCDDGTDRKQGRCLDRQSISYELLAPNDELRLIIELFSDPELDGDGIGDRMLIKRVTETGHLIDFEVIIDQGTLKENRMRDQEFHNSLLLNDRLLTNIISADVNFRPEQTFKYYVHPTLGLVAFRDGDGHTWVLEN